MSKRTKVNRKMSLQTAIFCLFFEREKKMEYLFGSIGGDEHFHQKQTKQAFSFHDPATSKAETF